MCETHGGFRLVHQLSSKTNFISPSPRVGPSVLTKSLLKRLGTLYHISFYEFLGTDNLERIFESKNMFKYRIKYVFIRKVYPNKDRDALNKQIDSLRRD